MSPETSTYAKWCQVSSQTVENLAAVEDVVGIPVFRPLISYDKQEIIEIARRMGSYEISIEPHMDCCSFLMPENPATHSEAVELADAESPLDVADLIMPGDTGIVRRKCSNRT